MRAFLPIFAYAALIFWMSSLPAMGSQQVPHLDKLFHLIEYGLMGVLLTRAWMHLGVMRTAFIMILTVTVGGTLAGLDEIWQGQVGRNMSWADWGADLLGLLLASLTWSRLRKF